MTQQKAASLTSSLFARKGKASPASLLISELAAAGPVAAAPANGRANGQGARRKPKPPAELPLLALVEAKEVEAQEVEAQEVEAQAAEPAADEPAPAASLLERGARSLRRVNGASVPAATQDVAGAVGEAPVEASVETADGIVVEAAADGAVAEVVIDADGAGVHAGEPADIETVDAETVDVEAVEPETVSGDANVTAIEDAPQDNDSAQAPADPAAPMAAATSEPEAPEPEAEPEAPRSEMPGAEIPGTEIPGAEIPVTARTPAPAAPSLSASQALRKAAAMHTPPPVPPEPLPAPPLPLPASQALSWRSAAAIALGVALGLGLYLALAGAPEPEPVASAPVAAPVVAPVVAAAVELPASPPAAAEPPAPTPAAEPAPEPAPEPARAAAAQEPAFDIIRIEPDGQSIIAGRAAPGSEWILLNNDEPIAVVRADANGEWVVLPDGALVPGANAFSLVPKAEQGKVAIPAPASLPLQPEPAEAPASAAPAPEASGADPRAEADVPAPDLPRPKPQQAAAAAPDTFLARLDGAYEVQLASVRESADANRERQRLSTAFPALLGGMDLRVQQARLDGAGVFYRVRSGALDDLGVARELCRRLEAAGQGCLVVRRPQVVADQASPDEAASAAAGDLPDAAAAVRQQAERPQ